MRLEAPRQGNHTSRGDLTSTSLEQSERERQSETFAGYRDKEPQFLAPHNPFVQNWLDNTEIAETLENVKARQAVASKRIFPPLYGAAWENSFNYILDSNIRDQSNFGNNRGVRSHLYPKDFDVSEPYQRRDRIPLRDSSSYSSFLEPGLPVFDIDDQMKDEAITGIPARAQEHQQKRQRSGVQSDISSRDVWPTAKHPREETFERRKRYKTNNDRYEPKQNTIETKTKSKSNKEHKRNKLTSKRKSDIKAGVRPLRAFPSKHGGNDRLTVCAFQLLLL